jgi:hypothetical protein
MDYNASHQLSLGAVQVVMLALEPCFVVEVVARQVLSIEIFAIISTS